MPSSWNPAQYERFAAERRQPFDDLLALVVRRPGMRVCDLGCGTGALTGEMHAALEAAETVGVDSSETMLAQAAGLAAPGLRFVESDIAAFHADAKVDLFFSNAALHWLPDHDVLLGRLTGLLAPGGQLAVQVPANVDHHSHTVADEIAAAEPFRTALRGYRREVTILAPERYAALLHRLGYAAQHVRLQVYPHLLPSRDDVVEWVKGTLLTDYERRLPPELFAQFLAEYRRRLLPRLDDTRPFFYPFKRILFWGQLPAA